MNDLVTRLATGEHPVEITLRPERSVRALRECLDRGYVHIRFTDTRGGTELGVPVDTTKSELTQVDFETETGRIKIAGELTLDFVRVRCIADIDVSTLKGVGHLEVLEQPA